MHVCISMDICVYMCISVSTCLCICVYICAMIKITVFPSTSYVKILTAENDGIESLGLWGCSGYEGEHS